MQHRFGLDKDIISSSNTNTNTNTNNNTKAQLVWGKEQHQHCICTYLLLGFSNLWKASFANFGKVRDALSEFETTHKQFS